MQAIERDTLQQIGAGQSFFDWLHDAFTGGSADEPDRWIFAEMDYNAQH